MSDKSRTFLLGTFCRNEDRERAEKRGRFALRDVSAYSVWYSSDWDGCVEYRIQSTTGIEANKIAKKNRIKDEELKVSLEGWGWWRKKNG